MGTDRQTEATHIEREKERLGECWRTQLKKIHPRWIQPLFSSRFDGNPSINWHVLNNGTKRFPRSCYSPPLPPVNSFASLILWIFVPFTFGPISFTCLSIVTKVSGWKEKCFGSSGCASGLGDVCQCQKRWLRCLVSVRKGGDDVLFSVRKCGGDFLSVSEKVVTIPVSVRKGGDHIC